MRNKRFVFYCFYAVFSLYGALAFAQSTAPNADGTALGNAMMPTTPGQVVNPSGVNSTAWAGSTTLSTSNISGTGAFTTPTTSSSAYSANNVSGGLSVLGNQAVANCANYVPTGNVAQDQYCAGVNFLANNCISPSSQEKQVIGATGVATKQSANCVGTFGAGQVQNYQLSGNDATLAKQFVTNVNNNSAVSGGCQVETVTTPAQSTTYNCVVSNNYSTQTCNQQLTTTVNTNKQAANITYSCSGGTIQGQYCESSSTAPAPVQYSCAAGWTLSASTCSQTQTNNASPNYQCPVGYTLNGSNCDGLNNVVIPATVASYSCPAGWSLNGTSCSQTQTQAATIASYGCPAGQTLSGTSCIATSSSNASANISYSCPSGWTLGNGNSCYSTATYSANVVYVCGAGWTNNGNGTCSVQGYTVPISGCPSGAGGGATMGSSSNTQCTCTYNSRYSPGASCPSGYISHNSNGYIQGFIYNKVYSCSSGTLQNGQCVTSSTTSASINYSCNGSDSLSNSTCTTTNTTTANTVYTCNSGGALSGSQCTYTTTSTSAATPNYSCPSGYSLSGTTCSENLSQSATPNYSCPAGQTLSGTNCNYQQQVVAPATISSYSCPAGYTLNGTTCSVVVSQSASISYSCPAGSTLSGSGSNSICTTVTTTPATVNYSCADGSAPQNGLCIIYSVSSAWQDNCTAFETSAGSKLTSPQ